MINGKWSYPLNDNGEVRGFNDQGIELFLGNPIDALAKEIIQNSIDAADESNDKPVVVEFTKFIINPDEIPLVNELIGFYEAAAKTWEKDDIIQEYCSNAVRILRSNEIDCLRISDFNTQGITGSLQTNQNSAWFNLTKGSGSTEKVGISGGSKGIGKNATFANSSLRLVFYNTFDKESKSAFQGLTKMVSIQGLSPRSSTEQTAGPIYFGNEEGHLPLTENHSLDASFSRNNRVGSDIFIIGFNPKSPNWEQKIIDSALINFMYAIHVGKLELNVQGYHLSKENYYNQIFERKSKKELKAMASILNDSNTVTENFEIEEMDDFEVKILKMDEASATKFVWQIRKPWMLIETIKRARLPLLPFSGMVIIKGEKLNKFLRKLESAKHDAWEVERTNNQIEKELAIKVLRKITENVVMTIKKVFQIGDQKAISPPGNEILVFKDQFEIPERKEVLDAKLSQVEIHKTRKSNLTTKAKTKEEPISFDFLEGDLTPSVEGEYSGGVGVGEGPIDGKPSKINDGDDFDLTEGNEKFQLLVKEIDFKSWLIVKNYSESLYEIVFSFAKPVSNFKFSLVEIDHDGKNSSNIEVISASQNKSSLEILNNQVYVRDTSKEKTIKIVLKLNKKNYFASELILYGF
jgi:hypothetical protein